MNKIKNKAAYIICVVLTALILLCAVAVFTVTLIARSQNKEASFFGYSFALVVTDSMEPEIATGSFILIKNCEISQDLDGENVVFVSRSGLLTGERIVHKVIATEVADGEIYLTTQGVKDGAPVDDDKVTSENFVGVCVFTSYAIGVVVSFISDYGVPLAIAIIALPVIYSQIKRVVGAIKECKDEPDGNKDGNDKNSEITSEITEKQTDGE